MLFCKCIGMSQQNNNNLKLQYYKKNKTQQNDKNDKKPVSDVEKHEDNKVVVNLSTISFILKDLSSGENILGKLQDSHIGTCPICQITREEYKFDIKYISLLEKIINSVIHKETTELLEGIHEDDKSSTLQQTDNSTIHKKEENQKNIVSNPEQHSLRCLLIRLQRALGELILQICFSLSRKTKSEKLNRLSKLNMTDITLLELRTLNYQFSALTDHIIHMFKDSENVDGPQNKQNIEKSNKLIVCLKQKINDSINVINSILNSVKKVHLHHYQNKPLSEMSDGKCCNRMYPHVHCNMSGNNFIMKYVKSKGNKQITDQSDSDGKSKHSRKTEDSTAAESRSLPVPTNNPSSFSMHILHDKLLNIIRDSAELQKKVNEILSEKLKAEEKVKSGTSRKIKRSDEEDETSMGNIETPSNMKSMSRKELQNVIDEIILDACNKYSSHTECMNTSKDLKKNLRRGADDTKNTLVQKQTDYLVNHAHLSPGLFSYLSRNNNGEVSISSAAESSQRSEPLQLGKMEDVSTSREYLPYSVSIESLPLSPEEIEELSSKIGKGESIDAEKYRHENSLTNRNNIFGMNIRRLSDLINDDKCERDPHFAIDPNAAPYSPSLTSLPLTNEELDELVVKLNKSKCDSNNQENKNTEMQVMYFETDINPKLDFKNRRSLSYSENMKIKPSPKTATSRIMNVNDKNQEDFDKILKTANNLSRIITPHLKTNRTYHARRNKSIEQYKDNNSKSGDSGDTQQFKSTLQKESFTIKKNTDLEIMNSINKNIKFSNHNLYRLRIHNKRSRYHKSISVNCVDSNSECRRSENMLRENNNVKRFLNRDMRTNAVEKSVNRLNTKSVSINKSKHKINSNKKMLKKRQQKANVNIDVINIRNRVKSHNDKYRVRNCITIHYSSIIFHYVILKLISLNQQNSFVTGTREIQTLFYKPLLNTIYKHENYLKLNHIICNKTIYRKSIKQYNCSTISVFPVEFYVSHIIVVQHIKIIHAVKYTEYKNNLYFNIEKEETLLAELKVKAKRPVVLCRKKRSFKKISKVYKKKPVQMKNWCGDTRNLGQYSFSELDITDLDSKLSHYMYLTLGECLNLLNNNMKYRKKYRKDSVFKNITTQESAQEFLNNINKFLKSNKPMIVHKKQVLSQVFNSCNNISDEENNQVFKKQLQKYKEVSEISNRPASFHNIHKDPLYLFDILGRPLTDNSGHVLQSRKGESLLKYNDLGKPISDMFGGPVFDINGLRPNEYEFNATRTPYKAKSTPLVNAKHEPLKVYDCNGRPLTSVDGIPLVNSTGEIILKFDCQGHPISDILGKPIYISNR